ncbi:DUF3618 domain-containing protein [Micromonospora sp. LZ34]
MSDPDRIRWEIEHTRNELSSDIDALADRVNPRRIAGERVGQARGALTRAKEKVMGAQSDGHGAGQRMSQAAGSARQLGQQGREQVSHAAGSARQLGQQGREQVSHAAGSARQLGQQGREQVSHAAGSARQLGQQGREQVSHAAGSARQLGQQGREQVSHAAGSARQLGEQAQGNPLAAGLIAFGAGLLVSSLIPPSRPERQWAGQARDIVTEHSDVLRQQASQVGHQVRDNMRQNMREPVQHAAASVGSTAMHGASAVREQGRSATHQVQGQAHEAADDLRRR